MISEHPQTFFKNGQCLVQREYLDELRPLSVRRYSGAPCCPMAFCNHSGTASKPSRKCARAAPMTSEIARMVVQSFRAPSAVPDANGLTTLEAEILILLAEGLSNKEIAQKATISAMTVRIHLEHILKKLHVRCRAEAVAKYFRTKPWS
jgi:DNA-binding CsgD family transcriptional regulator